MPGLGAGGVEQYIGYMRDPFGWGDECTLAAMAHILQRPIHVVTSHESAGYMRIVDPPSSVARSMWGFPIVVALYGEAHYEGTRIASVEGAAISEDSGNVVDAVLEIN